VKKIAGFSVFVSMVVCFTPVFLYADPGESGAVRDGAASRVQRVLSPYTLSVQPLFGMLWGEGEEQVYDSGGSGNLQSQILWELKPLWYTGMILEFGQRDPVRGFGFFGVLSTKFGIPTNTGFAEDRDWSIPGGELTNFSRHDNITNGAVMMDLAAGLNMPIPPFLAFRFSLGLSYVRFAWAAYDGYIRYGKKTDAGYMPLEESDLPVPTSGAVLSYSQDWLFMPVGISLVITPGRLFSGAIRMYVGQVFSGIGRDDHYLRTGSLQYSQFVDIMTGGLSLEPEGEFRFSPLERCSLTLRLSWRSITANSHSRSLGRRTGSSGSQEWESLGNIAGGLFRVLDAGIGFEIRL
jgi:outer membrane protease